MYKISVAWRRTTKSLSFCLTWVRMCCFRSLVVWPIYSHSKHWYRGRFKWCILCAFSSSCSSNSMAQNSHSNGGSNWFVWPCFFICAFDSNSQFVKLGFVCYFLYLTCSITCRYRDSENLSWQIRHAKFAGRHLALFICVWRDQLAYQNSKGKRNTSDLPLKLVHSQHICGK